MWTLGRHRLTCGDSAKAETFALLMGSRKANLVITDPPYNVNYEGSAGKIENDNMADGALPYRKYHSALRRRGTARHAEKHYDSSTEYYSDKLASQLIAERRSQYEQGIIDRTSYQNLRKAAAMPREFRQAGKITLETLE